MSRLFFGPRDLGHTRASGATLAIIALALLAMPLAISDYEAMNFSFFLLNVPLGLSVALIWGYCGVLSFGQVAFFGLAGYFYGLVAGNMIGVPGSELVGIVAAVALSVCVSAVLAYFLFFARVENWIIPVITLVFTLLLETFLSQTAGYQWRIGSVLLGGYNGMTGIPSMRFLDGDPLYGYSFYYYVLVVVMALFVGLRMFMNSRYGSIIVAMREDLERTELLGYDVRIWSSSGVFLLAAGLASPQRRPLRAVGQLHHAHAARDWWRPAPARVIWAAIGGRSSLLAVAIATVLMTWFTFALSTQGNPAVSRLCRHRRGGGNHAVQGRRHRFDLEQASRSGEPDTEGQVGNPGMDTILRTRGLNKRFGGVSALNDVNLSIGRNEIRCVIGPNGAGKSTLFKVLCNLIRPRLRNDRTQWRRPHARFVERAGPTGTWPCLPDQSAPTDSFR